MIRINLAKGRKAGSARGGDVGAGGGGIPSFDGAEGFVPISDEEIRKQAITRLLLLFLFPAGLWAWEFQSLPTKKIAVNQLRDQLSQLSLKNENAKKAQEDIKTFETQQKSIQAQIDSIETIRKGRLQEVKVLDAIQSITPSKVWLQKIDVTAGKMSLVGFAMTDSALTSFLDALARSAFLKDVSLVRSNEHLEDSTGLTVKRFEVICGLEYGQ